MILNQIVIPKVETSCHIYLTKQEVRMIRKALANMDGDMAEHVDATTDQVSTLYVEFVELEKSL